MYPRKSGNLIYSSVDDYEVNEPMPPEQRLGDVCAMTWEQFSNDGYVSVVQEKTGEPLEIYCPERLQLYLQDLPRKGKYLLPKTKDEPIAVRYAQELILEVRRAIGAERYVPHGWRYTAAVQLAEAGCSDAQIQAVTGHRTLAMVQKYRRRAAQKRMSKEAQIMRGQNDS